MTNKKPNLRIVADHEDPAITGEPINAKDVLTDEQLENGGLVAVKSYMRTSKSKDALRQKKKRKKKEAMGLKQTGVTVPDNDEARTAMRIVATALRESHMTPAEIVEAVSGPINDNENTFTLSKELSEVQFILSTGGIRAWWIRRALSWK
jgi:hypothetical protein